MRIFCKSLQWRDGQSKSFYITDSEAKENGFKSRETVILRGGNVCEVQDKQAVFLVNKYPNDLWYYDFADDSDKIDELNKKKELTHEDWVVIYEKNRQRLNDTTLETGMDFNEAVDVMEGFIGVKLNRKQKRPYLFNNIDKYYRGIFTREQAIKALEDLSPSGVIK